MKTIIFNSMILTLLVPAFVASKEKVKLDYSAALYGKFDSNIGQNITEVSKFYASPALAIQWYPANGNIYGRVATQYELHVTDRAPKYNEPLLDAGIGGNLRSGNFRWNPELSGALWYANKVVKAWDTTNHVVNFQLAQREIVLTSPFRWMTKSNWFDLGIQYTLTDPTGKSNNSSEFLIEPAWSYRFAANKDKPVRFKSIGIESAIDINKEKEATSSYFEGELGPQVSLAFGSSGSIKMAGAYSRRLYGGTVPDPQSSDTIRELTTGLSIGASIDIPVVSDLHILAGGKLRFKQANISDDEYNRHTAYVCLKWDHKH